MPKREDIERLMSITKNKDIYSKVLNSLPFKLKPQLNNLDLIFSADTEKKTTAKTNITMALWQNVTDISQNVSRNEMYFKDHPEEFFDPYTKTILKNLKDVSDKIIRDLVVENKTDLQGYREALGADIDNSIYVAEDEPEKSENEKEEAFDEYNIDEEKENDEIENDEETYDNDGIESLKQRIDRLFKNESFTLELFENNEDLHSLYNNLVDVYKELHNPQSEFNPEDKSSEFFDKLQNINNSMEDLFEKTDEYLKRDDGLTFGEQDRVDASRLVKPLFDDVEQFLRDNGIERDRTAQIQEEPDMEFSNNEPEISVENNKNKVIAPDFKNNLEDIRNAFNEMPLKGNEETMKAICSIDKSAKQMCDFIEKNGNNFEKMSNFQIAPFYKALTDYRDNVEKVMADENNVDKNYIDELNKNDFDTKDILYSFEDRTINEKNVVERLCVAPSQLEEGKEFGSLSELDHFQGMLKQIEENDPFYIRSSDDFRKTKSSIKDIITTLKDPKTAGDDKKLNEQIVKAYDFASLYVENKTKEIEKGRLHGIEPSPLAQKRLDMMERLSVALKSKMEASFEKLPGQRDISNKEKAQSMKNVDISGKASQNKDYKYLKQAGDLYADNLLDDRRNLFEHFNKEKASNVIHALFPEVKKREMAKEREMAKQTEQMKKEQNIKKADDALSV